MGLILWHKVKQMLSGEKNNKDTFFIIPPGDCCSSERISIWHRKYKVYCDPYIILSLLLVHWHTHPFCSPIFPQNNRILEVAFDFVALDELSE